MPFTPTIYRSYDIRGVVPDELDESDAEAIGRAFVVFTKAKKVLVARDMRVTGEGMHAALIRGITMQGADVVDIGLATSPLFYYAVWKSEADGGVMVTASHNPGKYNGFKMTLEKAIPISKDTGILAIRDLVEKHDFTAAPTPGNVSTQEYLDGYITYALTGAQDIKPMKVIIDCGNGMGGLLMEQIIKHLPQVEIIGMYTELDGSFPHHEANPIEEKNMKDLQARVVAEHADAGVAFDGDGDRVGFTDERGKTIPGEFMTAILGQEVLKDHPGATILYDLRSSWATKEAIATAGGVPIMSRVGHSYIKAHMRKDNAVFAGEMSSHFYFQEYYAESALRAMLLLLRVISEQGKPLSAIIAPLHKYAKTPEINFEVENKDELIAEAKRRYADGKQFELDGLSIEYDTWWFNIRASGTEPLLRLNMEAKTAELLEQKKQELFSFLGQPISH
ncbi:MAG TPA: phosphomannomutase/phosphoglucomutase [Candidatus Andersenbacteria bacterium]|nr:phosphomannomutase/phosphoglucomutase [Candidatus Andersenbacteria bacterium]